MAAAKRSGLPELPTESLTLGNSLRVRLVPLPHLQSATVSFFIRVGSRYETARTNGLSHFLEHMLYRGTAVHPAANELNLAIERLGGTLDATTHVDFTSYFLSLPPEAIANGVELLGEVLQQPLLTELRTEKQIIREEILEDLNEEGEQIDVDNVSRRLLYPDHPLGFTILGPLDNLDGFETEDLRRHHSSHYTACNSVLCVTGAFDAARDRADDSLELRRHAEWQRDRASPTAQQSCVAALFVRPGARQPDRCAAIVSHARRRELRSARPALAGPSAGRRVEHARPPNDLRRARAGLRGFFRKRFARGLRRVRLRGIGGAREGALIS